MAEARVQRPPPSATDGERAQPLSEAEAEALCVRYPAVRAYYERYDDPAWRAGARQLFADLIEIGRGQTRQLLLGLKPRSLHLTTERRHRSKEPMGVDDQGGRVRLADSSPGGWERTPPAPRRGQHA